MHYFWWYTDERTGKRRKGLLEPDLPSAEVRHRVGAASDIGKKSAPSE